MTLIPVASRNALMLSSNAFPSASIHWPKTSTVLPLNSPAFARLSSLPVAADGETLGWALVLAGGWVAGAADFVAAGGFAHAEAAIAVAAANVRNRRCVIRLLRGPFVRAIPARRSAPIPSWCARW